MSPTRSILVALAALSLCSSCSPQAGNGFVVTVERHLSALFTRVEVQDGLSVTIGRGEQRVSVTTDDNLVERFVADIDGETLKLRMKGERDISATFAHVEVSSELLRGLEVSGGSQVIADATQGEEWRLKVSEGSTCNLSTVIAQRFYIDVSGDSQVDASGMAQKIFIEASSNSRASADQVQAQNADVKASGGSTITVQATREIKIESDGNSKIAVSGNPAVQSVKADNGSQVTFVGQ